MEKNRTGLDEIIEKLGFKQRIITKIFRKDFEKIYHTMRIKIVNDFL